MFISVLSSGHSAGAAAAGLSAAVSSAIAYAAGLEDAKIAVDHTGGLLYLDGTAPTIIAIERAIEIAMDIAGSAVYSRIRLA